MKKIAILTVHIEAKKGGCEMTGINPRPKRFAVGVTSEEVRFRQEYQNDSSQVRFVTPFFNALIL